MTFVWLSRGKSPQIIPRMRQRTVTAREHETPDGERRPDPKENSSRHTDREQAKGDGVQKTSLDAEATRNVYSNPA